MGDRTSVTLTVLLAHKEVVEELYPYREEYGENELIVDFGFQEVNYGELEDLDKLRDKGIAYTSRWEAGGDYTAGKETCRFTAEGELIVKKIYDVHEHIDPSKFTPARAETDPTKQLAMLLAVIEEHEEMVDVLDWENQVEYGKRYLAAKLIKPE